MYLLLSGATIVCLEGGEVNKYFGIAPRAWRNYFTAPWASASGLDVENEWETDLEDSENEGDVN
jgi:hypothetical protein